MIDSSARALDESRRQPKLAATTESGARREQRGDVFIARATLAEDAVGCKQERNALAVRGAGRVQGETRQRDPSSMSIRGRTLALATALRRWVAARSAGWRGRFAASQWVEGLSASSGGLAAVLALEPRFGPVSTAISERIARVPGTAQWLAPYLAFLGVTAAALSGALAALLGLALLERFAKRGLAPLLLLAAVAACGARIAPWLAYAGPAAAIAMGPLLVGGRVPAVPWRWRDPRESSLCLAAEAACFGA